MKTRLIVTVLMAVAGVLSCYVNAADSTDSAEKVVEEKWIVLFDGSNLDAWRGSSPQRPVGSKWSIVDGVLQIDPAAQGSGGDILTKQEFTDFDLVLDFKLTQGANSGIKYYFANGLGLEYQLLDDDKHPDARGGQNGNRTLASLYDLIAVRPGKPVKPIGQWNTARIVAKDNTIQHWLNGTLVLEYQRGSDSYNQLVAISKYKNDRNFGMAPKGPILLQDHGDKVFFRNIRIRPL